VVDPAKKLRTVETKALEEAYNMQVATGSRCGWSAQNEATVFVEVPLQGQTKSSMPTQTRPHQPPSEDVSRYMYIMSLCGVYRSSIRAPGFLHLLIDYFCISEPLPRSKHLLPQSDVIHLFVVEQRRRAGGQDEQPSRSQGPRPFS
jgi:hypothetical protein